MNFSKHPSFLFVNLFEIKNWLNIDSRSEVILILLIWYVKIFKIISFEITNLFLLDYKWIKNFWLKVYSYLLWKTHLETVFIWFIFIINLETLLPSCLVSWIFAKWPDRAILRKTVWRQRVSFSQFCFRVFKIIFFKKCKNWFLVLRVINAWHSWNWSLSHHLITLLVNWVCIF